MIHIDFASEYRQYTRWLFASQGHPDVLDSLDDTVGSYLEAILWAETDNSDDGGGDPLDMNYNLTDFSLPALLRAVHDCWWFQRLNKHWLVPENSLRGPNWAFEEQVGHDFWLTRARHGCGFWERDDWEEAAGDALTASAHTFGEINVYVGGDGKLYFD